MATINGAKTLGLEDKIGSFKEGKKADIIIINLNEVTQKPLNDIVAELVYNTKGINVETVIVNGNILMENRKIKKIDEKSIYDECNKIICRIRN